MSFQYISFSTGDGIRLGSIADTNEDSSGKGGERSRGVTDGGGLFHQLHAGHGRDPVLGDE
jgi:hypothetical protein